MKINRRQFLAGLAGLGAAVILPKNATAAQVTAAWTRLLADPWYFDVGEYGTLIESGVSDPTTRSDVWDDISISRLKTPQDLIYAVEDCEPLVDYFRSLASDERDELQHEIDEDDYVRRQLAEEDDDDERASLADSLMAPARRAHLERLVKLLEAEDRGWRRWLKDAGIDGLPRFHAIIEEWLAEPVEWDEQEWFPRDFGGQGKALSFFQHTAADVADELGVVIVEAEHPGSTYFAAELRNSIEDANAAAERLGLPFRFRAAGASS
jgi:hypothetical protein